MGERGTPLLDLFDNVNFQDFSSWEQFIPIKGRCMPSSCFEPQALTPSKAHLHSNAPTFLCKGSYIISSVNPTSPQLQMGISCMTRAYYMFNNFSSEAPPPPRICLPSPLFSFTKRLAKSKLPMPKAQANPPRKALAAMTPFLSTSQRPMGENLQRFRWLKPRREFIPSIKPVDTVDGRNPTLQEI